MTMHEFAGQPRCEAAKVVVLNTVSAMNRTNLAEVARCETSSQPSAYRSRRQKRRTRMGGAEDWTTGARGEVLAEDAGFSVRTCWGLR